MRPHARPAQSARAVLLAQRRQRRARLAPSAQASVQARARAASAASIRTLRARQPASRVCVARTVHLERQLRCRARLAATAIGPTLPLPLIARARVPVRTVRLAPRVLPTAQPARTATPQTQARAPSARQAHTRTMTGQRNVSPVAAATSAPRVHRQSCRALPGRFQTLRLCKVPRSARSALGAVPAASARKITRHARQARSLPTSASLCAPRARRAPIKMRRARQSASHA